MWSEENLIIAALILDEEERLQRKRQRRFGIHNMLKQRSVDGEYFTLFPKLLDDDTKLISSIFPHVKASVL